MSEKFIVRKFYSFNDKNPVYEDMEFLDLLEAARYATNLPKTSTSFDEVIVYNQDQKMVFVPKRK